jgi:hypothetical protein
MEWGERETTSIISRVRTSQLISFKRMALLVKISDAVRGVAARSKPDSTINHSLHDHRGFHIDPPDSASVFLLPLE